MNLGKSFSSHRGHTGIAGVTRVSALSMESGPNRH